MTRFAIWTVAATATACAHHSAGPPIALRAACADAQYWNGSACVARGVGAAEIAAGKDALAKSDVDGARAQLDAGAKHGPLDHAADVSLWESRGIAAAYDDDLNTAKPAFDMLLSLDPGHFLSCDISPKATRAFEQMRNQPRRAPEIDVTWPHDGKVGEPVPLALEVIADPKGFLSRAEVYVRRSDEPTWHAADLTLPAGSHAPVTATLPAIDATKDVQLQLYVRAYDRDGNEVLRWADPTQPREVALRYDPPTPWYRTWWGITALGSAAAIVAGVIVYEVTIAPSGTIDAAPTVMK